MANEKWVSVNFFFGCMTVKLHLSGLNSKCRIIVDRNEIARVEGIRTVFCKV